MYVSTEATDVSTEGQQAEGLYEKPVWVMAVESVVLATNAIMAIGGNSLVIFLVLTKRPLRTRGNTFIANLALADVLYGFMEIVMVTHVIMRLNNPDLRGRGLLPKELCQLQGVLISTLLLASIFSLTFIAVNRYVRVCKSSRYGTMCGTASVRIFLVVIWPASVLMSLIPLRNPDHGIVYDDRLSVCILDRKHDILQLSIQAWIGIILPSSVILYCYMQIFKQVRASRNRLTANHAPHDTNTNSSAKQNLGRFVVFCSFTAFWTPFAVVTALDIFMDVAPEWHVVAGLIVCFSSSINPILYGVFNTNFRKEYLALFRVCRCGANRVASTLTGSLNTTNTSHM